MSARIAPVAALAALLASVPARADPPPANAAFAKRGDFIVGVERASPIVVAEIDRTWSGRTVTQSTALFAFGETPSAPPLERVPRVTFDYALRDRLTIGTSMYFATIFDSSDTADRGALAWGFAPRVGWVLKAGRSFAWWPRAGISYASVARVGATAERLEATIDAPLCVFPRGDVALTLTPAIDALLAANGPNDPFSTGRFTFTAGLFGRFGSAHASAAAIAPEDASLTPEPALDVPVPLPPARALANGGRVVISADRMVDLVDYAQFDAPATGPRWQLDSSLSHSFAPDHLLLPRFAADIAMGHHFTLGTAFAFNLTPYEQLNRYSTLTLVTSAGTASYGVNDQHTIVAASVGVEPRIGAILALSDRFALWLRGGFTYELAFIDQPDLQSHTTASGAGGSTPGRDQAKVAHELDVSLDPEIVFFASEAFGITIGPVMDVTALGGFRNPNYPAGVPGAPIFHVGGTAGALVAF